MSSNIVLVAASSYKNTSKHKLDDQPERPGLEYATRLRSSISRHEALSS